MSEIVSLSGLSQSLAGQEVHLDHARAAAAVSPETSGPETVHAASGDSVALSNGAGLAHQALSAGVDARASRVAELRQQIQSGQYNIDPAAISQAILDSGLAGE